MAVKGLNILYTTVHFPLPLIGGDRIKQYHIIKHLAESNKVFLVSMDRGYEVTQKDIDGMRSINVEPCVFPINPFRAYASAAILSPFGKPLEVNYFRNCGFSRKVKEIINNNKIDLIMSYYLRTTNYVRGYDIKKILVSDDCRTFYQSRTYKESTNLFQRAVRKYESSKLRKYESEIVEDFDVTTYVTSQDLEEMRKLNNKADLRILSNGVDTGRFCPPESNDGRSDLLFTGILSGWVNNLIVKKIVEDILPGIKIELPGVKLHLVGSRPSKDILKYESSSVIIHPNVPDLVPYLQKAALFVHPHLGGSGIQNKLLEAMSCGCPVVTTPSGAWGFNIVQGHNGFIANNDSEFIGLSVKLLKDRNLNNEISKNAREYILRNHKWEMIYESLDNIVHDVVKLHHNT